MYKRLEQWTDKLKKLEEQKEKNINRYILPLENKIEKIKAKLKKHYDNL